MAGSKWIFKRRVHSAKKILNYAKENEEILIEKIYLSMKEHGDNSGSVLEVYEGLTEYTDDVKSQILPCEKKDYERFKEEFKNEYSPD